MNCEQCEDQLLELLYGELPSQQAALVQSHANDCDACLAALDELKDAMGYANAFTFDEPPASFDAPIMEAARSHVLREDRIAKVAAADATASEQEHSSGLLTWLRGLMTGPQFAATAAMVMVLGVSIWMLRKQTMQGDTAMQVEPAAKTLPASDEFAPAEPKPEATPATIDEERAADEPLEAAKSETKSFEPRDEALAQKQRRSTRDVRARRARTRPSRSANSFDKGSESFAELEGSSRGFSPPAQTKKMGPSPVADALESESALGGAAAPEAPTAARSEAAEAKRETVSAYNRGINLYEARRYAEAARAFEEALSSRASSRSDTLIYLARSYRQRGDCARAIKPYEAFVRENPKDSRVGVAQKELNDCRSRIARDESDKAKRSGSVKPSSL